MKIIAYIFASILIFFGVMFIWSAFGTTPQPANIGIGLVTLAIGFAIIWFTQRKNKVAATEQNISVNIDLPGEVKLETMQCQACGGSLTSKNIEMQSGAPMIVCPYCETTYQLNEEPKW